jgi:hypothetical protein
MISVVDVSGSMEGIPMEVAVALGVLLSHGNEPGDATTSPYYKMVLPFDDTCVPVKLDAGCSAGDDRFAKPAALKNQLLDISWGGSTNLEAVFTQIATLESKRFYDCVGCEDEPFNKKRLAIVIFSDMDFNSAFDNSSEGQTGAGLLQPDVLKKMWNQAGLSEPLNPLPLIVFWNVRAKAPTPFPAGADAKGVVLMAGDSDGPFQALLTADFSNVTPAAFMKHALEKIPFPAGVVAVD